MEEGVKTNFGRLTSCGLLSLPAVVECRTCERCPANERENKKEINSQSLEDAYAG